ncbi:unnamed protein product [Arabidopsis arenosa]|uniref:Retrotransposon gag domain-containing protein n=1 Tax=Arabidopsis arenosa TaxID=38785 RepID=A0A8S1ZI45_ARAAE|nr:unnamed protein product [Arabidopsis arenosa]
MYDFYESVERHHQGVDRHHTGNRPMTLGDYNRLDLFYENRRAIRPPAFERSDDLGLQPAFYTLVSQHPFHGLPHEQPMDHIERFEDLVSIIKARVVSEDYLHHKLFSYSLVGEAASWLKELIPGSLTTWQQTKMAFLRNFTKNYGSSPYQALPPPTSVSKIESMLGQIQESLERTLERFPRIENNLTTASHDVLMESEDEFAEIEENDADFLPKKSEQDTGTAMQMEAGMAFQYITFDDNCKLEVPLQRYVEKMITKGVSVEDASLLTKDISAILVYEDPEKKPNMRQSVAISKLVNAMIQCSIPEKLPDPGSFVLDCNISTIDGQAFSVKTSKDITAGYVKELDSIEKENGVDHPYLCPALLMFRTS